jgi:phosphoribosylcarboxyaminoimidazole (NCAIR) mutase
MVSVAVAGMSNALGGVLSANLKFPVINCPPFKDKLSMMTDIYSSIRNPSSCYVNIVECSTRN